VTRNISSLFIRQIAAPAKAILFITMILLNFQPCGCRAQASEPAPSVFVPSLFDPHNRPVASESGPKGGTRPIRFLTSDDYPPFETLGADGILRGFNVDVARAICDELKLACSIQPRRWDTLLDALAAGEGDAVIASLKSTEATRSRVRFTAPYYLTPGRFIALAGAAPVDARPEGLLRAKIGVEAGTAHEAFLQKFFTRSTLVAFPDRATLLEALRAGKIDLAFGDAVSLAIWMNDPRAGECCAFRGGPYLEPAFFGEGVGIALRPEDEDLRRSLNRALQRLDERGALTELYLKYFPIGFY
jgi:polar amino acid transport system substrate-binding protein